MRPRQHHRAFDVFRKTDDVRLKRGAGTPDSIETPLARPGPDLSLLDTPEPSKRGCVCGQYRLPRK